LLLKLHGLFVFSNKLQVVDAAESLEKSMLTKCRSFIQFRGIDFRYSLCFRMDEDGDHCFLKCNKVKGVGSIRLYQIVSYIIPRCFELL
jgi:hypothetical protein